MQIFFLVTLVWAVQLKALPSNISHGHADEELTQYPELAARAPGMKYPFQSRQPFLELAEAKSVCEPASTFRSDVGHPPQVEHCKVLRDQIAANPGIWFIVTGEDWDHDPWGIWRWTRIAQCMYHFCILC